MAKSLGRAPSTVMREVRRNMPRQQYRTRSRLENRVGGMHRTRPWEYRPSLAQRRADSKAARPKPAKLATNPELRDLVQAKLWERLSPKQIAWALRYEEFPNNPEMWVSHDTIYQSIYVPRRGRARRAVDALRLTC